MITYLCPEMTNPMLLQQVLESNYAVVDCSDCAMTSCHTKQTARTAGVATALLLLLFSQPFLFSTRLN